MDAPIFKKMVISRPVQPLGRDIGVLPGTMEEKMVPWLMPIQDNLQFLMGNDKITLETYMKDGIIEQIGTPLDLFERPATKFVATFIGSPSMNMIKASIVKQNNELSMKTND